MKNRLIRMLAILLLSLMILPAPSAFAASQKVYVIYKELSVYSGESRSNRKLGTMTYGESMTLLSYDDDWARVINSAGKVGYCDIDGLSLTNPNNLNIKLTTKTRAPIYERPDDDSKLLYTCKKGVRANIIAQTKDGDWYRVKNGSRYGYMECDDLNTLVWVYEDSTCSLLSQYGGESGVVSYGQAYELLETKNTEYSKISKIRNNKGEIAYIDAHALTDENPHTEYKTMYTQVSGKILRKQINAQYGGKSISKNKAVILLSYTPNGNTAYVKYDGKYYYVAAIFLHEDKAPSGGRTIYVADDMDGMTLHKGASFTTAVVDELEGGEAVKLVGASSNGAHPRVKTKDGKTGYQLSNCFESD